MVLTPIAGISLERYAELTIAVESVSDPATQLSLLEALGVSRQAWAEALRGWAERLRDPGGAAAWAEALRLAVEKRDAAAAGDRYLPPPRITGPMPAYGGYPPPPQPLATGNASGFAEGALLWVLWSDGQRYRGVALASVPGQTQVRLDSGEICWVENRWLSPR